MTTIDRQRRLRGLQQRAHRLPAALANRCMARYVELVGGFSWWPNAHALTDEDIDLLETEIACAELEAERGGLGGVSAGG